MNAIDCCIFARHSPAEVGPLIMLFPVIYAVRNAINDAGSCALFSVCHNLVPQRVPVKVLINSFNSGPTPAPKN